MQELHRNETNLSFTSFLRRFYVVERDYCEWRNVPECVPIALTSFDFTEESTSTLSTFFLKWPITPLLLFHISLTISMSVRISPISCYLYIPKSRETDFYIDNTAGHDVILSQDTSFSLGCWIFFEQHKNKIIFKKVNLPKENIHISLHWEFKSIRS